MSDIAVVGAGSYGSCLAMLFGRAGHRVSLWCRNPETADSMQRTRANEGYLPGHTLPATITVTSDLEAAVRGKQFVVGVTPSHGIRAVLGAAVKVMDPDAIVINASKGLDEGSLATIDQVYAEIFPERLAKRATFLSGPTFANEIAAGTPAAIVLAGRDEGTLKLAQEALTSLHFRIYRTDDVIGVLIGGALKNVVAIAAGVCDGLGFGSNTRVALMTRGLAEITRIGVALGAHPQTFAGLSGMGDLVLTCSVDASRNRRVGLALGRGKKMAEILGEMNQVAEGVKTAKVAHELATKLGVEAPIMDVMHAALHENLPTREAVERLLARPVGSERD
ncbi:MAG TPA: NAD(P)H-dependent glycerol-3-phosphate dehydrogenase [Kofleriaceae bacterium]|nr:NAD(P)H-dependent glycerol-3-phosphate dehydrogenase [Kofleriaceae bacterium]